MGPTETMSNIMHDNMAYHDALSDVLPHSRKMMMSTSGTPTHTAGNSIHSNSVPGGRSNTATPSHGGVNNINNSSNTGDIVTPSSCSNNSFLSNTSGATINSSRGTASPYFPQQQQDNNQGIVYYMQVRYTHQEILNSEGLQNYFASPIFFPQDLREKDCYFSFSLNYHIIVAWPQLKLEICNIFDTPGFHVQDGCQTFFI